MSNVIQDSPIYFYTHRHDLPFICLWVKTLSLFSLLTEAPAQQTESGARLVRQNWLYNARWSASQVLFDLPSRHRSDVLLEEIINSIQSLCSHPDTHMPTPECQNVAAWSSLLKIQGTVCGFAKALEKTGKPLHKAFVAVRFTKRWVDPFRASAENLQATGGKKPTVRFPRW